MSPGYQALRESAAWLDLSTRGKIRVTGEDRARLLHSILSNEVKSLQPGEGNYHFLLDAQGHIQADAHLLAGDGWMLLDCEPEMTGRIMEHLDRYILADDVTLEDVTERLALLALEGPGAQPAARVFVEAGQKAGQIERWERAGAVAATAEDARVVRVEEGVPRYGEDFGPTTLPQETQQFRAWSHDKGCYLGQEIVERIRARGQVHRLLVRVAIEGAEPPAAGSPVTSGGREIGRLTSPVYSPRLGCALGLAILRREFTGPDAALLAAGRPARVIS